MTELQVLIWSNEHGAWWRAAGRGYTADINEAGRYSPDGAASALAGAVPDGPYDGWPNEVLVLAPECRWQGGPPPPGEAVFTSGVPLQIGLLTTSAENPPAVGATVHYQPHTASADHCWAATVTEIDADNPLKVGLAVLEPDGLSFRPLAEGGALWADPIRPVGSWHWPETS